MPMKKFGTAVVLAGGKSIRMGFDKQLLEINNRKIVEIIINKLREEFDEIIVVTNKPEYYIGLCDKMTKDIYMDKGPLAGIHAGLMEATSQYVYFVACDMPNIKLDYIRHMKKKIKDLRVKGYFTKYGSWIEPFNGFYSRKMISDIEKYLSNRNSSVNKLIEKLDIHYIKEKEARSFSPKWEMFLNLNTKEDLENFVKGYE